jgi:hypothetical protein
MHFSKQNRINKGINKLKEEIKRYVYDNMETIEPYLTTDIKMYETIQQSEQLWQWQKGRIFNETN